MRDFEHRSGPKNEDSLLALFVPVPDGLAELLGYRGQARFIGMFWSDEANDVVITDGRDRGVGESLRFLEYCGHRAVESELGDLNIGLFDGAATTWLVLDRQSGNLYYAVAEMAQAFLARQHMSGCVESGRIQLRDDVQSVVDEFDPALDELRDFLQKFTRQSGQ